MTLILTQKDLPAPYRMLREVPRGERYKGKLAVILFADLVIWRDPDGRELVLKDRNNESGAGRRQGSKGPGYPLKDCQGKELRAGDVIECDGVRVWLTEWEGLPGYVDEREPRKVCRLRDWPGYWIGISSFWSRVAGRKEEAA